LTLRAEAGRSSSSERTQFQRLLEIGFFGVKNGGIAGAVSVFPKEIYKAPRSWAERACPKLIYFNEVDRGGYCSAWQEPTLSGS
jgi:hypothetical protein